MASRHKIKAVETTIDILHELKESASAGVSDIAGRLDMPKSTVHDHLRTLTDIGLVVKNNGEYRLGTQLLLVGESVRENMPVYQTAKLELESLAKETGEYVSLMIEENRKGVLLFTAQGQKAKQITINPTMAGTATQLHSTAPGKAILSNLCEDQREEILNKQRLKALTPNTTTDPKKLRSELSSIRDQGFAVDNEERIEGMYGVAVPLFCRNSRVVGAISVYTPIKRVDDQYIEEELPQLLKESANIIEVNLNYS